jgi:DNA-binding beta-propeller fold protein YncE
LNRALSSVSLVLLAALAWTGCGGSSGGGTNTKKLSNIKNRVFVSNSQSGYVQVVDVDQDKLAGTAFDILVNGSPTFMDSTPDHKNIAVFDATFNSVAVVSSTIEDRTAKAALDNVSDSIRITSDAKFVYAAVRNRVNSSGPNGAVQVLDVINNVISASYPVPNARWLALSNDNKQLLVFPDDLSNTPYMIDLSVTAPAAIPIPGTYDHPIAAYFSSDNSKAYILNCGPECGGAQASVTELTLSTFAQRTVPVPGATVATLDGTTLYVAGQNATGGVVSVVDTGAMTVTSSKAIGNGRHGVIRSVSGKVWIGATGCNGGGCLSVFDPSSGNVIVDNPAAGSPSKGNVTGMDFDTPKNLMYVCEGGELLRYDPSGNPVSTLVDIVGTAYDVRSVPPVK